jgi:hypothetical protein
MYLISDFQICLTALNISKSLFFAGGFDLQENSAELVERVLTMLEQFLVSNQTLKLDNTFKVYLKVLSIDHMSYNKTTRKRQHPKKTKEFYQKKKNTHYGARVKPLKRYNYFWALDVPDSFPKEPLPNVFQNECLLTSTILALSQNQFYKSERKDRKFLHLQYINSVNAAKRTKAGKIMLEELYVMKKLTKLSSGPHELEVTTKVLSDTYNCQFFIFDSIHNSNKLMYMYPETYQNDLIPIYLFKPQDAPNHLVFIRHINSYFKANIKICFGCKKTFLSHKYQHLCPKIKCCFCCRRFFQTENTYIHENLKSNFCDSKISLKNNIQCNLCNVTCFSEHCYKGHKLFCSGKGTFGYKCLKCNKFTYRYGSVNGSDLKNNHKCVDLKRCVHCHEFQEKEHLCRLKKENIVKKSTNLAFIGIEHFDNSVGNCKECIEKDNTFCEKHDKPSENLDDPVLIVVYKLEANDSFTKYELSYFETEPKIVVTKDLFSYDVKKINNELKITSKNKITQDFKTNYENLQKKNCFLLTDAFLQLIISWHDTTFVCQDEDSLSYVSCHQSMKALFIRA